MTPNTCPGHTSLLQWKSLWWKYSINYKNDKGETKTINKNYFYQLQTKHSRLEVSALENIMQNTEFQLLGTQEKLVLKHLVFLIDLNKEIDGDVK